jgi:hypothetical protein
VYGLSQGCAQLLPPPSAVSPSGGSDDASHGPGWLSSGCPGLSGGDSVLPLPLPAGLAEMPAGADLSGMLEGIDVAQVSGFDAVEVVKAAYRQLCHERARFLQVVVEVGLREPLSGDSVRRLEVPDEFGAD